MRLVWKLLRQHISVPQFAGFFFANLVGMLIVLLGFQFYHDVLPVFTAKDSFLKADYLILSKRVGTADVFTGRGHEFSGSEIDDLSAQPFVTSVGKFTSTNYRVDASLSVNGIPLMKTDFFFESVPDDFVDVSSSEWEYRPGDKRVPIILPRSYINMYNFGFAQTRSLPKISEGLLGMIDLGILIRGNGQEERFHGKVIGFSNRLNTILVPQSFMDWSNARFAPGEPTKSTRLIVQVGNPADERVTTYLEKKGYEVESDKLAAEKTTYFLRMVVSLVMVVGLVISVLSFYILMLSVYLLVQKNASKLENLLLIGYSPARVAMPYQVLTIALNVAVLFMAWALLSVARGYYMDILTTLFPQMESGGLWPSIVAGLILFLVVSVLNVIVVRRKVMRVWHRKDIE
ncbi:MAG TPA: ABC transporter permease [Candidatus Prevotella avicola]|uniref:ABC transporter permease n=1 Tax=Candidatus Prevotella avicola TaxID=2838738 RepID=A0A9D2FZS1_9BACT|nr:ABC transporter permease [Prevotella sp.]HIZ69735.1 ABC transporter permease [Candidatus Prevotella avicola]